LDSWKRQHQAWKKVCRTLPRWSSLNHQAEQAIRNKKKYVLMQEKIPLLEKERANLMSNKAAICVFLDKQNYSQQVKGILSSLLYYHGYNNLVLESDSSWVELFTKKNLSFKASWGSRGISENDLKEAMKFQDVTDERARLFAQHKKILETLKKNRVPVLFDVDLEFDEKEMWMAGGRTPVYGGQILKKRIISVKKILADYRQINGTIPRESLLYTIYMNIIRGGWTPFHISGEIMKEKAKVSGAQEALENWAPL
ncbi:MAG: hypothetical protein ABIF92_00390, partial [archaeon]